MVAVDRNAEAAAVTADLIRGESGEVLALTADVSRAADVRQVVETTLQRHGRIDVLHNNVGLSLLGGLETTSEELWDTVMPVNVKGMFLACQQVVPVMVRQGGGAIVNISAIAGVRWLGKAAIAYARPGAARAGVVLCGPCRLRAAALGVPARLPRRWPPTSPRTWRHSRRAAAS